MVRDTIYDLYVTFSSVYQGREWSERHTNHNVYHTHKPPLLFISSSTISTWEIWSEPTYSSEGHPSLLLRVYNTSTIDPLCSHLSSLSPSVSLITNAAQLSREHLHFPLVKLTFVSTKTLHFRFNVSQNIRYDSQNLKKSLVTLP